jgi:hypothetical protein
MVVRDDLFPGGTKVRSLGFLFEGTDEVVYASPARRTGSRLIRNKLIYRLDSRSGLVTRL